MTKLTFFLLAILLGIVISILFLPRVVRLVGLEVLLALLVALALLLRFLLGGYLLVGLVG